ncbi:hypothetical protein WR25_08215 [Diploscapter pachys]|uniref:Uncharacterized protein n=1 Tax=Diploscapter pachys TaxID=2018661 RepID=A0A2A2L0J7_9BILA|nr:hypothetical protein WR25_08215 [Diploscapter pachys]
MNFFPKSDLSKLQATLFKHDNTVKYTAAPRRLRLKSGMTKFPEQVSAKIAAGMIKLIQMKPDTATVGSETNIEIPADYQWTQLIYQEIEHALRNSPTTNTKKPLFEQISDEDYIYKLKLDQQAVQNKWYKDGPTLGRKKPRIMFFRSNIVRNY